MGLHQYDASRARGDGFKWWKATLFDDLIRLMGQWIALVTNINYILSL